MTNIRKICTYLLHCYILFHFWNALCLKWFNNNNNNPLLIIFLEIRPQEFWKQTISATKDNCFIVWLPLVINGCSMKRRRQENLEQKGHKVLLLKAHFLVFYLNSHFNRYFWLHNSYFVKSLFNLLSYAHFCLSHNSSLKCFDLCITDKVKKM